MQTGFFTNTQLLHRKIAMLEKRNAKITVTPNQLITKNVTITLPIFTNVKFTLPIKNLKEIINSTFEIRDTNKENSILSYTISNYNIIKNITLDNNHLVPIVISSPKRITIDTKIAKFLTKFSDCEKLNVRHEGDLVLHVSDVISFECRIQCDFVFADFSLLFRDLWFLGYDWTEIVMCVDEFVVFYLYDDETTVIVKINKVT